MAGRKPIDDDRKRKAVTMNVSNKDLKIFPGWGDCRKEVVKQKLFNCFFFLYKFYVIMKMYFY